MAFKGMLRHPLSVSSLAGTCQEGWGAGVPGCWWGLCWPVCSHFRPSVYLHYNLFLAKHQKLHAAPQLALCVCF